jgi:hypothetical protein
MKKEAIIQGLVFPANHMDLGTKNSKINVNEKKEANKSIVNNVTMVDHKKAAVEEAKIIKSFHSVMEVLEKKGNDNVDMELIPMKQARNEEVGGMHYTFVSPDDVEKKIHDAKIVC